MTNHTSFDDIYPHVKDERASRVIQFKELVSRITGISLPVFGISWTPPTSEREAIRRLILFLEDRRVLYYPDSVERAEWVTSSILQIRNELTKCLQAVGENSEAVRSLRIMRATCRRWLDRYDPAFQDSSLLKAVMASHDVLNSPGAATFFTDLGELRGIFGIQIEQLCGMYGIDLEGEIVNILPPKGDDS